MGGLMDLWMQTFAVFPHRCERCGNIAWGTHVWRNIRYHHGGVSPIDMYVHSARWVNHWRCARQRCHPRS